MRELADRPELWIDFVRHDASQRVYEELLSDAHVTAWLICWMDDHDTGFHDHDVSAGAVAVVSGGVREERLAIGGAPRKRTFAAGDDLSLLARRHPPRAPRRQRSRGHAARLLAAAAAHGRLRDRRRRRSRAPHRALLGGAAPAPARRGRAGRPARDARRRPAWGFAPARRSTPCLPPIRIRLTISGANRPCSTTPGVALSRAASARGSSIGAEVVGDQASVGALVARRAASPRRAPRASSARRTARAPAAPARSAVGTAFSAETITTKRRAAAATIFSRVCAAAAALDQPARGVDLVGAVDRQTSSSPSSSSS